MEIYNTRVDMLYRVKPNSVIAELGVYKGDFSQQILDSCQPQKLVLIDMWANYPIQSGDADGNNLEHIDGEELLRGVIIRFGGNGNVSIVRETTNAILSYPDDYFDMVYIDADHSYEAVKNDLNNAFLKVKNGGYIMGHDYEFNRQKTDNIHFFGVKQAVDEFCSKYSLSIDMKAMDGCVSFGIQVKK